MTDSNAVTITVELPAGLVTKLAHYARLDGKMMVVEHEEFSQAHEKRMGLGNTIALYLLEEVVMKGPATGEIAAALADRQLDYEAYRASQDAAKAERDLSCAQTS